MNTRPYVNNFGSPYADGEKPGDPNPFVSHIVAFGPGRSGEFIRADSPSPLLDRDSAHYRTLDPAGDTASSVEGRRELKPWRLDLIPAEALELMGEAFAEGEAKYGRLKGDPCRANWTGLDLTTDKNPLNHALWHLGKYADGDTQEDHLAHALANLAMLAWFSRSAHSPYQGLTHPEILAKRPSGDAV